MSASTAASVVAINDANPKIKGSSLKGEARPAPRNPHPNQVAFEKKLHDLDNRITVLKKRWDELRGVPSASSANGNDKRSLLIAEIKGIKDQIRALDDDKKRLFREQEEAREALSRKKGELAAAKDRLPFKTVGEIDYKIQELEKLVESGQFRLSEEKGLVQEISKLRKARRELITLDGSGSDAQSVGIRLESIKVQIQEKTTALANLREQSKRISAQIDELDGVRSEERGKQQDRRAQMDRCKKDLDAAYEERRALFEENQKAKKAQYEAKLRREARWAEEKRRRELRDQIEELEEKLALFNPETIHEKRMSECASLTAYFAQFTLQTNAAATAAPATSALAAPVGRAPKLGEELAGAEVVRKGEDEDSFYFKPSSKTLKKKAAAAAASSNQSHASNVPAFSMNRVPIQVLAGLGDLSLPLPSTAADLPTLLESIERRRVELDARKDEGKEAMQEKRQEIEKQIAKLREEMEKKPAAAVPAEEKDEAEH